MEHTKHKNIGESFDKFLEDEGIVISTPCPLCAKNIAKWYEKGRESVKRQNKSGCCCIIDDDDIVVSACGAHAEWRDGYAKD